MLLWNAVLRQCLQSYLVTAINTMIATTKISIKQKLNLIITLLVMAYLYLFPYFTYKNLRLYRNVLHNQNAKNRYGSLYTNLDTHKV